MTMIEILKKAADNGASDIHITKGSPPIARVKGALRAMSTQALSHEMIELLVKEILSNEQYKRVSKENELDLSYADPRVGRFRVNVFRQSGSFAMVLRVISSTIPDMKALGLPPVLEGLCNKKRGLILVTGPTGSGKSTTLASMLNYINNTRHEHILTIEDPIEYVHKHKKSIVNQREIGEDTNAFANALRAALREDPDIILVGEMRDLETISTAITAAETGHLVMSTLHTIGAAKTIDRVIDVFPPHQQQQIRTQLASVLEAVISQQILPKADGSGRVAAFEVMTANSAISNLIREGKTHQMQTIIQTNASQGMVTMDGSLLSLYKNQIIDRENLLRYSVDYDRMVEEIR